MSSTSTSSSRPTNAAAVWVNLFPEHALDGRLELTVLGGVDDRVDAAVDERQHHAEMVEPAGEVDDAVDGVDGGWC